MTSGAALTARVTRGPEGITVEALSAPIHCRLDDGRLLLAIAGPHPVAADDLARWVSRGCPDPAPVRQGFAACLIDPRSGEVTMVASPRNEVTIFYSQSSSSLLLSTYIRDLLNHVTTLPALNLDELAGIASVSDASHATVFEGIERLPIGHQAMWRPGSQAWVRRWFRPHDVEPFDRRRDGDEADVLRQIIREAVDESLPMRGDVAAHLSGGLDSTTVVATAASILYPQGRTVHTLSHLTAPGEWPEWLPVESDDEASVRIVSEQVPGIDAHLIYNTGQTPLEGLAWMFDRTGYPFLNPSNSTWIRAFDERSAQQGLGLTLTGAHGSIAYSVSRMTQYRRALMHGDVPLLVGDIKARRALGDGASLIAHDVLLDLSPALVTGVQRARGTRSDSARRSPVRWKPMPRSAWEGAVISDPVAPTVLQYPAQSSWFSDPLSDGEVSRLLFSLPASAWLGDGRDRALARRVMRGLVPDEVRLRTARGMQGLDAAVAVAANQQQYREALERVEASSTAAALLDLDSIRDSMIDGVPTEGRESMMWQLHEGRTLGFGLFVAWYDDLVAARR